MTYRNSLHAAHECVSCLGTGRVFGFIGGVYSIVRCFHCGGTGKERDD